MKKSEKEKRKSMPKRKAQSRNDSFSDMGIEPPKIYREAQKNIVSRQDKARRSSNGSRKNNDENITRAEKRNRDNKKRKKKNKLRKILIYILLVLVVVSVGAVLSLTAFFHITDITVSGNEKYATEEIIAQCPIDIGENLFLADTKSAKEKLEKNLPYIYNAQIKRKLPYTIEITITEAQSSYYISNKDKTYILLDNKLKVLETNAQKAQGIEISKASIKTCVPGEKIQFKDDTTGSCLIQIAQVIKDSNFNEITAIYSNSAEENYVVYDKRITFELGSCDNLENKIYQGLASCEKLDETNPNVTGNMDISGGKSIYFAEK